MNINRSVKNSVSEKNKPSSGENEVDIFDVTYLESILKLKMRKNLYDIKEEDF